MTGQSVFVPGVPQQKGNIIKGRWGGYHDANKKLLPWMQAITAAIHGAGWEPILHGPVFVSLTFVFPRPKAHYGTGRNQNALKPSAPQMHTVAPDADKLMRSVLDALTESGAIRDDSQVAWWRGSKRYTDTLYPVPGVGIHIDEVARRRMDGSDV